MLLLLLLCYNSLFLRCQITVSAKISKWGRSKSSPSKIQERKEREKSRREGPLRRAPMVMSGAIDLHYPVDNVKVSGLLYSPLDL